MINNHIMYNPTFKPLARTLEKILLPAIRHDVFGALPARGGSGFRYSHSHTSGVESAQTRHSIPNAAFRNTGKTSAKTKGKSPTELRIAIGRKSGCRKSTLVYALQAEIKEVSGLAGYIFHTDNYFKLPLKDNHKAWLSGMSSIGFHKWTFFVLDDNISTLKRGAVSLQKPVIDCFGNTKHNKPIDFSPFSYCIVEDAHACLSNQTDCTLFMNQLCGSTLQK